MEPGSQLSDDRRRLRQTDSLSQVWLWWGVQCVAAIAMSSTEELSLYSLEEDLQSRSSYSSEPFAVRDGEDPLVTASRSVQMAWQVLHGIIPRALLASSFLCTGRKMSSSCTGAYTAEMGLAVIEKTVNDSGLQQFPVGMVSSSCHEPWLRLTTG